MASVLSSGGDGSLKDDASFLFSISKLSLSSVATIAIVVSSVVIVLLKKIIYPSFDPREPPVLRPKIPFIGHLISMARESTSFYARLYKERFMPICTLPMLNGKMYLVNSPTLISAVMRNKDLSFDPFVLEFSSGALGLNQAQINIFSQPGVIDEMSQVIHASLLGESLYRMNAMALGDLAIHLNSIKSGASLEIPELYPWLRQKIGLATMKGLFGEKNPLDVDTLRLLELYEPASMILAMNIVPKLIARKALAARAKIQALLTPYYCAHYDERPDTSALIRGRAAFHRSKGMPDQDISIIEFGMAWASTTNTIPSLFWLFLHVFSRPDYVERIRSEVFAITAITDSAEGRIATISVSTLEKECLFLVACYREVMRQYNWNIGNRRVMKDTVIKDGEGREYLLKKGINVQWCAVVPHTNNTIWGKDTLAFDPERWIDPSAQDNKHRRGALIPFGGGKTLCPGRNFALTENLGFICLIALGFNVRVGQIPSATDPYPGGAMRIPVWKSIDQSMGIKRREGWEDVEWRFST